LFATGVALAVAAGTPRSGKPPDTQACTPESARAAAPAGVTIGPINDLNPKLPRVPTGALLVRTTGDTASYCLVTSSVVTNPSTGTTANFAVALPLRWNQKFLFSGCGGYCGVVFQSVPNDAAAADFLPTRWPKGTQLRPRTMVTPATRLALSLTRRRLSRHRDSQMRKL
jgi:hypothetical protein